MVDVRRTLDRLLTTQGFLILDGAMGTELERRGFTTTLPLWSAMANVEAPDLVGEIHKDYLDAGVDIITANTFRTTDHTISKVNTEVLASDLTQRAVDIARNAIIDSGRTVFLAGSIAPLEDCYSPELVPDSTTIAGRYSKQLEELINSGVDLILAETMINHSEVEFLAQELHRRGFPFMMSFTADDGRLLDGTPLDEIITSLAPYEPAALLVNCRRGDILSENLRILRENYSGLIGAYGNGPGHPDSTHGWINADGSVTEYLDDVAEWYLLGAKILGGCCGTTPEHIRKIYEMREGR